jgi:hypothetical protein
MGKAEKAEKGQADVSQEAGLKQAVQRVPSAGRRAGPGPGKGGNAVSGKVGASKGNGGGKAKGPKGAAEALAERRAREAEVNERHKREREEVGARQAQRDASVAPDAQGVRSIDLALLILTLQKVLGESKVPLVVDPSARVEIYLKYQGTTIIEAKDLFIRVAVSKEVSKEEVQEELRKQVVSALRLGHTLHLLMSDGATDLRHFSAPDKFPFDMLLTPGACTDENVKPLLRPVDLDRNGQFYVHKDFNTVITTRFEAMDYREFLGEILPWARISPVLITPEVKAGGSMVFSDDPCSPILILLRDKLTMGDGTVLWPPSVAMELLKTLKDFIGTTRYHLQKSLDEYNGLGESLTVHERKWYERLTAEKPPSRPWTEDAELGVGPASVYSRATRNGKFAERSAYGLLSFIAFLWENEAPGREPEAGGAKEGGTAGVGEGAEESAVIVETKGTEEAPAAESLDGVAVEAAKQVGPLPIPEGMVAVTPGVGGEVITVGEAEQQGKELTPEEREAREKQQAADRKRAAMEPMFDRNREHMGQYFVTLFPGLVKKVWAWASSDDKLKDEAGCTFAEVHASLLHPPVVKDAFTENPSFVMPTTSAVETVTGPKMWTCSDCQNKNGAHIKNCVVCGAAFAPANFDGGLGGSYGEDQASCSCVDGTPCVSMANCRDWKNRHEVATSHGWQGYDAG